MKRLVLMIVSTLIFGVMFWTASSCTKENKTNSAQKIDRLLFKSDNIEWYNATTSEVKFKRNPNGDYFFSVHGGLISFIVCLDEIELFTLDAMSFLSSVSVNHPVLILGGEKLSCYYIGRGYPNWEYWTEKFWTETNWDKKADWVKEREKNWKAIEPGWNMFIEQLQKEGKYRK